MRTGVKLTKKLNEFKRKRKLFFHSLKLEITGWSRRKKMMFLMIFIVELIGIIYVQFE